LVPCPNLVLPSLEPPAHTFRALERCWHAGEGLPYCPVTSRGSSGAANDRAGEGYQVRARYQIRANALLPLSSVLVRLGPVLDGPALCVSALRGVPLLFVVCVWGGGGGGSRDKLFTHKQQQLQCESGSTSSSGSRSRSRGLIRGRPVMHHHQPFPHQFEGGYVEVAGAAAAAMREWQYS